MAAAGAGVAFGAAAGVLSSFGSVGGGSVGVTRAGAVVPTAWDPGAGALAEGLPECPGKGRGVVIARAGCNFGQIKCREFHQI